MVSWSLTIIHMRRQGSGNFFVLLDIVIKWQHWWEKGAHNRVFVSKRSAFPLSSPLYSLVGRVQKYWFLTISRCSSFLKKDSVPFLRAHEIHLESEYPVSTWKGGIRWVYCNSYYNFLVWRISNLYKSRQNNLKNLHVSITQLQQSQRGQATFRLFRFCPVILSVLYPLHEIPDRRMGSRNREAFKVLLPVHDQSSFDSICSSTVPLIGRGWNCRSRKYLGDHWWSPSLFRHDNRGLATPGESLQASHN